VTRHLLAVVSVLEVCTGIALLVIPSAVGQLLLGAAVVARVAGIAIMGLGIACRRGPPAFGMVAYSGGVAVYLACAGYALGVTGPLLWRIVGLHVALAVLIGRNLISGA
jgi:hypothetical protein